MTGTYVSVSDFVKDILPALCTDFTVLMSNSGEIRDGIGLPVIDVMEIQGLLPSFAGGRKGNVTVYVHVTDAKDLNDLHMVDTSLLNMGRFLTAKLNGSIVLLVDDNGEISEQDVAYCMMINSRIEAAVSLKTPGQIAAIIGMTIA